MRRGLFVASTFSFALQNVVRKVNASQCRCEETTGSVSAVKAPLARQTVTPAAAATWKFGEIAVKQARDVLLRGGSSVDAVVEGIRTVELDEREQYFVGVGGLPNADGVMELDAAIMNAKRGYGAVMAIQNIATPIVVARLVMNKSEHNVFVGDGALCFALEHGMTKCPEVLTQKARAEWLAWKRGRDSGERPHDTIGLICLDKEGNLAAGTSTSGWKFKHSGRVGDSPLIGSGLYCDGDVGAAVATGDGEEIMRTCLSFLIVEMMRQGKTPQEACVIGIRRMLELDSTYNYDTSLSHANKMHQQLTVGVVAMDKYGNIGSASTLCEGNEHRGAPHFPASCWRGSGSSVHCLEASTDGNTY